MPNDFLPVDQIEGGTSKVIPFNPVENHPSLDMKARLSKGRKFWNPIHSDRQAAGHIKKASEVNVGVVIHEDTSDAGDNDPHPDTTPYYPPIIHRTPTLLRNVDGSIRMIGGKRAYIPNVLKGGYHYWINTNGDLYQLTPENISALGVNAIPPVGNKSRPGSEYIWVPSWNHEGGKHGNNYWATGTMNDCCIMICLRGNSKKGQLVPRYTKTNDDKTTTVVTNSYIATGGSQRTTLVELLADLYRRRKYIFPIYNSEATSNSNGYILKHGDLQWDRSDPGDHFPMEDVVAEVREMIGLSSEIGDGYGQHALTIQNELANRLGSLNAAYKAARTGWSRSIPTNYKFSDDGSTVVTVAETGPYYSSESITSSFVLSTLNKDDACVIPNVNENNI